jgi:hypothetical protein
MKTFYEMIQILEGRSWMDIANSGPSHWDDPNDKPAPSFSKEFIGPEDSPPNPFYANIDVEEGYWTCDLKADVPFFAYDYKLNGSENHASMPVQEDDGVMFKNPGKRLELLPPGIKDAAVRWVQKRVDWEMEHYEENQRKQYDRD